MARYVLIVITIPLAIFIVWINLKKDVPKWNVIAMLLSTLLLIAYVSREIGEGINRTVDILIIPSLVFALAALSIVVHRMARIFYKEEVLDTPENVDPQVQIWIIDLANEWVSAALPREVGSSEAWFTQMTENFDKAYKAIVKTISKR